MNEELIRAEIRRLIKEDGDGGGDGGGSWSGYGGGYGGGGYQNYGPSLYSTFIQPFVDVAEEARGAVLTATSKIQLLTNLVMDSVVQICIPFVKSNFKQIMAADAKRMQSIERTLEPVRKRTDQALSEIGGNYDGAGVFFVLFPHEVIAKNIVKYVAGAAAPAAKHIINTGLSAIDQLLPGEQFDLIRRRLGLDEALLREDDDQKASKLTRIAQKVFGDEMMAKVAAGPVVSKMQQEGKAAIQDILEMYLKPLENIAKVKSPSDLKKIGGDIDVNEIIQRYQKAAGQNEKLQEKDVNANDVMAIVRDVLPRVMAEAKKISLKRVERLKDDMQKLGQQHNVTSDPAFIEIMKMFSAFEAKVATLSNSV